MVSSEMKKVWAVELDLLNEFSEVCEEHNLRWFVHAGTMLGAIRHKGFIPWDDDIDVVMPRVDFEKLSTMGAHEFKHPYFYQTEETDCFFARNFARLRNSDTTAILDWEKSFRFPYNQGIFIDIFPMDNIPDAEFERKDYYAQLTALNNQAWQLRNMVCFYHPKTKKGWRKMVNYYVKHLYFKYLLGKKGDYHNYLDKHHALAVSYNEKETRCMGESVISPLGRWIWRREWVEQVEYVPFEMLVVPVPIGYDDCLKSGFGDDWRTPKQVSNLHGDVFFDVDKPYTEYLSRNSCW
jgi:lipopolysaccharide cholinephosphotransferase